MKQMQVAFRAGDDSLKEVLSKIRQWSRNYLGSAVMIQIFTEVLDEKEITRVISKIKEWMPEAIVFGCSSNGNILNGDFSGGSFVLVCSLFEYPSTRIETLAYRYGENDLTTVAEKLCGEVKKRPWVKGVQLLSTIRGMSMTELCDGLSLLPEEIQVFGGAAFTANLEDDEACVFANQEYLESGIVFLLMGGDELHIQTQFVTGWKPLGSYLHVTKADGVFLKELNHRPAYDIYYKYLHIRNDEHFFHNTLEFPFLYRHKDIDIMRAPTASNPDGSLTMTSDMEENVQARIAYGDPWTILKTTYEAAEKMLPFAPEGITVFSCAGRRTFWGNREVGKETEVYQRLAPTSGFYTAGEFLRTGKDVNQHNVTQVIAAIREGDARPVPAEMIRQEEQSFEGKVSMINRMATFIKATTEELEEANRKLQELAVKDVLTGVWNKNAYFSKINEINESPDCAFAVAIFDMNGLKGTNDTFGHECGDHAICDAVKALKDVFGTDNLYRIGGDEFIAVVDQADHQKMTGFFSLLDQKIEEINREDHDYQRPLSLSKGFAVFIPASDHEYMDTFRRADEAMYNNKADYYRTHDRRKR